MKVRYFALIFGIVYLLVGIMGLIPGMLSPMGTEGNPPTTLNVLEGHLLGMFHVNILHTLVHLVVGIWGILAYRSFSASRTFARTTGVIFLLLAVMGLIPGLQTLFGMLPMEGNDVWLHGLSGLVALAFGLMASSDNPVDGMRTDRDSGPVV